MSSDKSAEQRASFDRQIEQVERHEDDFSETRQRYERSLEQFREQFHAVGRHRESSLGERMQAGDSGVQHELEARRDLLLRIDRYVEEASEELEQTRSRIRQSFHDESEQLAGANGHNFLDVKAGFEKSTPEGWDDAYSLFTGLLWAGYAANLQAAMGHPPLPAKPPQ